MTTSPVASLASASSAPSAADSGNSPLIGAEVLMRRLQLPGHRMVLLDASFDLADTGAGEQAHAAGHLPGAIHLHLERDLSGPKVDGQGRFRGRHPLPERSVFAETIGRCGISPGTEVVVHDRQGAMFAARLWWMLRWLGHDAVRLLDGGVAAWEAAGGRLDAGPVVPAAAPPYPQRPALVDIIDADALAASLGRVRLIDARAGERFRGEVEPLDKAAGHIPGALNRFFKDNLDARGCFKPADQLRAEWLQFAAGAPFSQGNAEPHPVSWTPSGGGPAVIVHQCGSGATACHNLLAMEIAGLPGSLLYPGSWSEWSSDPSRPIARG